LKPKEGLRREAPQSFFGFLFCPNMTGSYISKPINKAKIAVKSLPCDIFYFVLGIMAVAGIYKDVKILKLSGVEPSTAPLNILELFF
ncbi:MAG: hypothetical protein DCF19_23605, partial [Pseudanabaena frigida]